MKDDFLNKSKANYYELTDEYSEFADNIIKDTIFKLLNFCANKSLQITKKKTYNIDLKYKILKTASYTIKIKGKNINEGFFEISNPFEFEGTRIWTTYKDLGKFWTTLKIIIDKDVHPDILVCFLIQDYENAYKLIKENRIYSEENQDINSFIVDEEEFEIDSVSREKQVLNVFTNIFNA